MIWVNLILDSVSIRRRLHDCVDLPRKIYKRRYVIPDKTQSIYLDTFRDELIAIATKSKTDSIAIAPNSSIARCIQNIQRESAMPLCPTDTSIGSAKMDALMSICEETSSQIIVWCVHRKVVDRLVSAMQHKKYSIAGAYGIGDSMTRQHRTKNIDDFKSGNIRILVCTIAALAEGHNFQNASHAVYFQHDWSVLLLDQSQNRIHRIGQKNTVVIEQLIMPRTLDEYIIKLLIEKKNIKGGGMSNSTFVLSKKTLLETLKGDRQK